MNIILVCQTLFYFSIAGVAFFMVLALLTYFGNPVLLVENSQLDENNELIAEDNLKQRIIIQYFVAASFDLLLAIIFLIFVIKGRKGQSTSEPKYENENEKEEEQNNLITTTEEKKPQEVQESTDNKNENNATNEVPGMSEAEPINA